MREHIPEGREPLSQRIGRHALVAGILAAVLLSGCGNIVSLSDQQTNREHDFLTKLNLKESPDKARQTLLRGISRGIIDKACTVDSESISCVSVIRQKSGYDEDDKNAWDIIHGTTLFSNNNYCGTKVQIYAKTSSLSGGSWASIYFSFDGVVKTTTIKGDDAIWNAVGTPQRMKQTCKELLNG